MDASLGSSKTLTSDLRDMAYKYKEYRHNIQTKHKMKREREREWLKERRVSEGERVALKSAVVFICACVYVYCWRVSIAINRKKKNIIRNSL